MNAVRSWWRAIRPIHAVKNLLVFVPSGLGLQAVTGASLRAAVILFLTFSLVAFATYVINDILDREADRAHPVKSARPFASGALGVGQGVIGAVLMLAAAAALAIAYLPPACGGALLAYLVLTLAYSVKLKSQPFLDVILLAGLFTIRLAAGSLVLGAAAPVSPWLMSFSMLFFTSLAMIKRHAELQAVTAANGSGIDSRGYVAGDLPLLLASGVASGLGAITMFMIYLINEQYPRDQYAHPQVLWAMLPVLLVWFLRMWHLTIKGAMTEDPVVYAVKDASSLALGATMFAILFLAIGTLW